jgi:hypothetical protein
LQLPDGSEEQAMMNLSLARIMYGTSQEYHATGSHASSLGQLANQSAAEMTDNSAKTPETFSELLHRAWLNISGKR